MLKYPESESSTLKFKREIPKNDQILKTIKGENYIKCILPQKSIDSLNDDQKILALFGIHPEITLEQIQNSLSISRSTATRCINDLINQKKVIRIEKTRSTRFRRAD